MSFFCLNLNCRVFARQFLFVFLSLLGTCLAQAKAANLSKGDSIRIDTGIVRKANNKYIHLRKARSLIKDGEGLMQFFQYRKKRPLEHPSYAAKVYNSNYTYPSDTFRAELQGLLSRHGYTDTVHDAFTSNHNTVFLEADITSRYFRLLAPPPTRDYSGKEQWIGVVMVDWKLVDGDKVLHTFSMAGETPLRPRIDFAGSDAAMKEKVWMKMLTDEALLHSFRNLHKQTIFRNAILRSAKDDSAIIAENKPILLDKPVILPENQKLRELVKSGVTVVTMEGHGSGFFVNREGYIITNYHVIDNSPNDLNVLLHDGSDKVKATVIRYNEKHDLALLKVDVKDQVPLPLSVEEIEVGTEVWAIGTPKSIELGQTVSKGILSAIRKMDKEKKDGPFLQTDVAVNPGNSGGALITADGQVRGVVTFKRRSSQGLNFAIPSATVLKILKLEYKPAQQLEVPAVIAAPETVPNTEPIRLPVSAPAKPAKPKN